MLILTRRRNETVCIGDHIRITVLGFRGDQCASASKRH